MPLAEIGSINSLRMVFEMSCALTEENIDLSKVEIFQFTIVHIHIFF